MNKIKEYIKFKKQPHGKAATATRRDADETAARVCQPAATPFTKWTMSCAKHYFTPWRPLRRMAAYGFPVNGKVSSGHQKIPF